MNFRIIEKKKKGIVPSIVTNNRQKNAYKSIFEHIIITLPIGVL